MKIRFFKIRETVLGFQCPPEVNPKRIEDWLVGHALEIAISEGTHLANLWSETQKYGEGVVARAQKMMANWLQNLGHD